MPGKISLSVRHMKLKLATQQPNEHDFENTPQIMKVMPVTLSPDPSPASGRGEVRAPLARLLH
jgi:hypothetical protein